MKTEFNLTIVIKSYRVKTILPAKLLLSLKCLFGTHLYYIKFWLLNILTYIHCSIMTKVVTKITKIRTKM